MLRLSLLTVLAASLVAAACGNDDTASSSGAPVGASADLTITIDRPDMAPVTYRITCEGDTSTIEGDEVDVSTQSACAALSENDVVSFLIEGPPPDRICTQQYGGPDVALIQGSLDGEDVNIEIDRTDGCGNSDWDDLLVGILPPAVGA